MNTKITLISTTATLLLLGSSVALPSAVLADTTASPTPSASPTTAAARQAARQTLRKTNADTEITRRITALNALTTRINGMTRVSADQKSSLLAQVQSAISDLTTLKTKIDADTDPTTLATDKQSIVDSYRIFALLIPKVTIMAHGDSELALADQMTANNTTIQTKIQTLQTAGKDVSSLQALLSDRQAKIADAQTQAQNAINGVSGLTPDGYPGNKTDLTSARDTLKTGSQDLQAAYQDLVKINQAAKSL